MGPRGSRIGWAAALTAAVASACSAFGYPAPGPRAAAGPAPPAPEGSTPAAEPAGRAADAPATSGSYVVFGQRYHVLASSEGYLDSGLASWYGTEFEGRPTSSGEIYDPEKMTAAHRSLPMATRVEVTNLSNGRRVVVRINDRGPFVDPHLRIIDLSLAAARQLGLVETGLGRVEVRAVP